MHLSVANQWKILTDCWKFYTLGVERMGGGVRERLRLKAFPLALFKLLYW